MLATLPTQNSLTFQKASLEGNIHCLVTEISGNYHVAVDTTLALTQEKLCCDSILSTSISFQIYITQSYLSLNSCNFCSPYKTKLAMHSDRSEYTKPWSIKSLWKYKFVHAGSNESTQLSLKIRSDSERRRSRYFALVRTLSNFFAKWCEDLDDQKRDLQKPLHGIGAIQFGDKFWAR